MAIAANLPEAPALAAIGLPECPEPRFHAAPHRPGRRKPIRTPGSILGFAVASLLPPQAELETIAVAAGEPAARPWPKVFFTRWPPN